MFTKKKIKTILQVTKTECGICCVAMIADHYGYKKPLRCFRDMMEIGRDGTSVKMLKNVLTELNFEIDFYKLDEISYKIKGKFPVIAYLSNNHFVIIESYNKNSHLYTIVDPAKGRVKIKEHEMLSVTENLVLYPYPNTIFKKEKYKESVWKPLKFLFREVGGKLSASLILSIITYMFTLMIPLIINIFLDKLSAGKNNLFSQLNISLVISSVILFLVFSFFRNKVIVSCEKAVDKGLLDTLIQHILKLPYKYFETRTTGDILFRINLLNSIRLLISEGLIRGIIDIGSILFIMIYMSIIAPKLIGMVLLILLFIVLISNYLNNKIVILNKAELTEQVKITSMETEIIEMIFDIKCLGLEDLFFYRLQKQYKRFQDKFKNREMLSRCNVTLLQFFQLFIPFILLIINALLSQSIVITIGEIVAYYTLSNMAITNCISIIQEFTNFRIMKNYLLRVNDILYEKEEVCHGEIRINKFDSLKIENLSFSYSENSKEILSDINIDIKRGDKIAIVGISGAGKSTLVKLLLGLYNSSKGTIKYNGIELTELKRIDLKKIIGIMPQDAKLFNGTIRYNLTFGDDSLTDDIIEDALKKANIFDDVMNMPLKMNTILAAGGGNLSGGQRQRIALARIFISNPELLILDEATSSLDGINEKKIMKAVNEYKCTQIIVSHRFSTISQADYIYLINNGTISEKGSIKELIKNKGSFYQLFTKQIDMYGMEER